MIVLYHQSKLKAVVTEFNYLSGSPAKNWNLHLDGSYFIVLAMNCIKFDASPVGLQFDHSPIELPPIQVLANKNAHKSFVNQGRQIYAKKKKKIIILELYFYIVFL